MISIDYQAIGKRINDNLQNGNTINDEYIKFLQESIENQKEIQHEANIAIAKKRNKGIAIFQTPNIKSIDAHIITKDKQQMPKMLNGYEKEVYRYLYVTRQYLKYLEYGIQYKKSKRWFKDLLGKILYMSYNPILTDSIDSLEQEAIKRYNALAPEERLANIASYNEILQLKDVLTEKLNLTYLYELANIQLQSYYIVERETLLSMPKEDKGEMIIPAPTIFYLTKIGYSKKKIEKLQKASNKLEVDDRLLLGLDIDNEEFLQIENEKKELKRELRQK